MIYAYKILSINVGVEMLGDVWYNNTELVLGDDGMGDLNQTFLNEYIRLEKLCKDLYKHLPKEDLRGVWNYTQDMKNTPIHIKRNIPDWDYHYRELERIRITKNNWSHQEDGTKYMPFTQDDIEYLRDFRESILNQTDPISQAHRNSKKSKTTPKKSVSNNTYYYERTYRGSKKKNRSVRSFIEFLLFAALTLGVAGALIYLINEFIPIF